MKVSITMLVTVTAVILAACDDSGSTPFDPTGGPAGSDTPTAALTSVAPLGPEVDPGAVVEVRFSHPIGEEAAEWAVVHRGGPTGPLVEGGWTWSDDHTHLTFHPEAPWAPGGEYTIHLGGGMRDPFGYALDLERHGPGLGGEWAYEEMMGGGPMMMGPGWRHDNGSYGMVFRFTVRG